MHWFDVKYENNEMFVAVDQLLNTEFVSLYLWRAIKEESVTLDGKHLYTCFHTITNESLQVFIVVINRINTHKVHNFIVFD